jgi:hypothetical protein
MKFRSLLAAAAALSLTTTPVLAQSVAADLGRTIAPVSEESALEGEGSILLILAVIAFGLGIYLLVDNEDDDPDSP